MGEADGN